MTAVLGNAVPDPSGAAAVDKLTATLEALVNAITGISKGGSGGSSGGGTRKNGMTPEGEKLEKEELAKLRALRSLFRQRSSALIQIEVQREAAEKRLQAQRSRALLAEQKSLESAEKMAKKMQQQAAASLARQRSAALDAQAKAEERSERTAATKRESAQKSLSSQRSREYTKMLDESDRTATALSKLRRYLLDLMADGGKLNYKHARRLEDLGGTKEAAAVRNLVAKTKQKETADEKQKKIDDRVNREKAFYDKMQRREARGLGFTEGNLARAKELNMPSLARHIASKIDQSSKAAKDKSAQKRVDDFEIQQHNMKVDSDKKFNQKKLQWEEDYQLRRKFGANATINDLKNASKYGNAGQVASIEKQLLKQKQGNFFGGFGRNLVIGKLYAAAHAALAPMEAFITGGLTPALKAWKAMTEAAQAAGENIAHTSGMATAAAEMENVLKQQTARLKAQNAKYGMMADIGGRTAAGMVGSSASLATGVTGAVGNAMNNPLTGLTDIVNQIGNAVGMADPGAMTRYNMVLRDLTATIGQGLAPVVNMITRLMKEFGDYLQPVVQDMVPKITEVMGKLFEAIKPLIPLFVKELTDTIKELVDLIAQIGPKLGLREMIMRGVGVPDALVKAGPGGMGNGRMMAGAAAGGLGGAALGAGLGSIVPGVGTVIGGVAGGIIGAGAGMLDATAPDPNMQGPGAVGGIMQILANMKKGNIAGAAVAQNATIGSGSDLARKASQEAFIASSAKGNIDPVQQLFQQAAQGAINFFQAAVKPKPNANGNGQAGIAPGKGEGAMEFGAGQGQFQKVARAMLSGMMNPFGVFG